MSWPAFPSPPAPRSGVSRTGSPSSPRARCVLSERTFHPPHASPAWGLVGCHPSCPHQRERRAPSAHPRACRVSRLAAGPCRPAQPGARPARQATAPPIVVLSLASSLRRRTPMHERSPGPAPRRAAPRPRWTQLLTISITWAGPLAGAPALQTLPLRHRPAGESTRCCCWACWWPSSAPSAAVASCWAGHRPAPLSFGRSRRHLRCISPSPRWCRMCRSICLMGTTVMRSIKHGRAIPVDQRR